MKKLILLTVALLLIVASSVSGQEVPKAVQDHDLPQIKPIYFILGCLSEYNGRAIIEKDADRVAGFYRSEAQAAEVFEKYLKLLVAEESIKTKIRKEISGDGYISFHSPELYGRVNSMYPHSFENCHARIIPHNKPDGPYVRVVTVLVSMELFKGQDQAAKLSFLAGAYARFGYRLGVNEFAFRTANAGHKIELIAELLKEFDCGDIVHLRSDPRAMPMTHTLKFTASPELRRLLESVGEELNGRDQVTR